jgi:hypothetical protein
MQEGWKIAIGVLSVLAIIMTFVNYFRFGNVFFSPEAAPSSWPMIPLIVTLIALTATIIIYNLVKLKKIDIYVVT